MITFGRYRIVHRIASGGMAEVYRAIAVGVGGFEKEVVLKRIRPELAGDPRFGAMFVDEARLAATLSHANIVQVLDFGRVDGEYFLALESVRGRDLRQVLDAHAADGSLLPLDLALLVGVELTRALDYAHRRKGADGGPLGLVHRDVSPHNVLLSFEGEVKLADFGIAKVLSEEGQTEAGALKGKVAYMSPEQAAGAPVDQRSDLFALGVLLRVMATGAHPFPGEGALEILERVKRAEAPAPRRAGAPLPAALEEIIARCMAREPAQRFPSAGELLRALEACVHARPTRATATDLSAYMKGRFPYEVPIPIIALDRLVEQELRLQDSDDGLAAFTSVTVRLGTGGAAAGEPAPGAAAGAAVGAAVGAAGGAVVGAAGGAAAPGASVGRGRESRRGRLVAAVVLIGALAAGAVALWRWLPAAALENGSTTAAGPTASTSRPLGPHLAASPASAPVSQPPAVSPATPASRPLASAHAGVPGAPTAGLRPHLPAPAKARPTAAPRPVGRGFARFRTEPAYAEVWIAGARRCNTPCTLELAAGTYAVRLVNPTLGREAARTLTLTAEHTRARPAEVAVTGFE